MEFSILNLLLVLLVAWTSGIVAVRLGFPSVLGELLGGILFGPPLLGWVEGSEALAVLADVGVLVMMAYIGMEIDLRELARASKAGLYAALGGFVTPFVLVYFATLAFGGTVMAAVFVGIAAGVTSLATKSRILVDLKLLDTRIAHVLMAGALVADTLSLIVFALVLGVTKAGSLDVAGIALVTFKAAGFFVLAGFAGLKLLPLLAGYLKRRETVGRTALFTLLLIITLGFAEAAELAGIHGILGAFLAGLFLRDRVFERAVSRDLMAGVRDASIGFLAPIFFVTAGFVVSLDVFTESLALMATIVGLATLGKIAGTALFYLPTGYGWREGITVGAGMNGRGAVEIIVAQIGLSMGLITQELFSILVFMAIFTTATVPVLLKWGTDWLNSRGELVRSDDERVGVVVVGAGPLARRLGAILSRSQPVCLIDRNADNCALARAEGLNAVAGNAVDEEELAPTNAAQARTLIALTPNAEVNALVGRLARKVFLIPHVHIVDNGDSEGHAVMREHLGAATAFGESVSLSDWDFYLDHEHVKEIRQPITESFDAGRLLEELRSAEDRLPIAVEREGQFFPFFGQIPIVGDALITLRVMRPDRDEFDRIVETCDILDLTGPTTAPAFFGMVAGLLAPRLGIGVSTLAARLQQPEQVRSAILVPGLAVPHVFIEGEGSFEMLIARSRSGLRLLEDEEPVHILFVIVGTPDRRRFHLQSLAAIARIFDQHGFEDAWMASSDGESLRHLILEAERPRGVRPAV